MTTNWHHSCHVRLGIRVQDFLPRKTSAELPITPGMETWAEDAGFRRISHEVVPYNAHVTIENFRKASTARVQLALASFPVDPRALRQVQIQIFGGVVSDREAALAGQLASPGRASDLMIAPDECPFTGNSYELFRGFLTSMRRIRNDEEQVVELAATDLTTIFTTAQIYEDPLRGIPKTARIDEVIRLLIYGDGIPVPEASKRFGLPGARGTVIVNDTGATLPTLADIHPPSYFDSKGNARRSRSAGSNKKIDFWSLMTDLCQSAGLWCYVRPGRKPVLASDGRSIVPGAELVISNPRTFNAAADAQTISDPTVRRFIDGYNVDHVEDEVNFTGEKAPAAVEVRSYDPTIRKTRFARFPKVSMTNRAGASPAGDRGEIKVQPIAPLSGPKAVEILSSMAVSLYELWARNEMVVNIKSETTMSALGTAPSVYPDGSYNSAVADMFWLRPGEPVVLETQVPDVAAGEATSRTVLETSARQAKIAGLVDRGFTSELATQIAVAEESPYLQRFFRVMKIEWDWKYPPAQSEDGSWSWNITAASYLDTRNAPAVLGDKCIVGIARGK
jgi:hypothetical protein